MEQAWADERAKTGKMEDKLQHSKREMETAAKLIDKLHEERKQMKLRIKNKNAVVMQQEQQIQQRQEHVEEAGRAVQEMRREMDRKN